MTTLRMLAGIGLLSLLAGNAAAGPTGVWVKSEVYDCVFATDDTVRVDVMLSSVNNPIDQAGLTISYNPFTSLPLAFIRIERGTLTSGWTTFMAFDDGHNLAIIASNATAIPPGSNGQFARLVFVNTNCAYEHYAPVCPLTPSGDMAGAVLTCGSVHIVAPDYGSLTVESISHGCGDAAGDTIEVDVRVENAGAPIDAAGLDVSFDPAFLDYVGYERGDLTAAWPFFDAAEVIDVIRVGGFTQTPVDVGSTGIFVTLRFVVHCCDGGFNKLLCTEALVDDFVAMGTGCGTVQCVALRTRPSSWGYVKSIYR